MKLLLSNPRWLRAPAVMAAALIWLPLAAWSQEAPLVEVPTRAEASRRLELRADIDMIRKRFESAIALYKDALSFTPARAVLFNKLGIAYHQSLDRRRAEKNYRKAIRRDPGYAEAWNNLGAVKYGRGLHGAAIKSYLKAIELNPVNSATRFNLAAAYFAAGREARALEQFRLALLIDPEVFERRGRGGVLIQERGTDNPARYNLMLARTSADVGYLSEAVRYLRRALESGLKPETVADDPAFAALRGNSEYEDLLSNPPAVIK